MTEKQKRTKSKRKRSRGVLATIGGLLLASALLRAGIGAQEAFAREGSDDLGAAAHATAMDTQAHGNSQRIDIKDEDLAPVLQALNAREARIEKREAAIDRRMQALSVAETEIDRKMAALEEAEQNLRATLALAQTAAEDDISRLTDVYAKMKPKQAAGLFEAMDPEFAAGFIGRMRADAAAAVMAGLSPTAAYSISVILAGRNADVPKE